MNKKMILYILGQIMKTEGLLMILPFIVGLIYNEDSAYIFLLTAVVALAAGFFISYKKPKNRVIYAKDGFVIVALSWIALSLFGAIPFSLSGAIPSYVDAIFETVSGFTTTGATILTNIEALPNCMSFWRCFTHWIGGMGVLVFVLAIVPLAGDNSMYLMRAEVPGPQVGKLVPKLKSTAMILYGIYIAITVVEIVLLMLGGMNFFDSVLHSFSTAGTGGFSNKNTSVAAYDSVYIDVVITIFMAIFGINFNIMYFVICGRIKAALKSEELKVYIGIIAVATIAITFNILPLYENILQALRYASFQVSSIITTTGFMTYNYELWPEFSQIIIILLMFIGACAGSTGGGIKVARLIIMIKSAKREIAGLSRRHLVKNIRFEGKTVDEETVRGVNIFFMVYCILFAGLVLLISLDGFSFETTVTSVITCINNVGPGLGAVGPTGNFSIFSNASKILLSFAMLLGRLEIFPLIILFSPSVWKSLFRRTAKYDKK